MDIDYHDDGGGYNDSDNIGIDSLSAKFAEIIPGAMVRTTNENPKRVSAIDLVMVVGGQNYDAARKIVAREMPNCNKAT